jgi:hypothetical protein
MLADASLKIPGHAGKVALVRPPKILDHGV